MTSMNTLTWECNGDNNDECEGNLPCKVTTLLECGFGIHFFLKISAGSSPSQRICCREPQRALIALYESKLPPLEHSLCERPPPCSERTFRMPSDTRKWRNCHFQYIFLKLIFAVSVQISSFAFDVAKLRKSLTEKLRCSSASSQYCFRRIQFPVETGPRGRRIDE